MKILAILFIATVLTFGKTSLSFTAGSSKLDALSRSALYSIEWEQLWGQGLGYEVGTAFMQSTFNNSDITIISFPYAGFKQTFKLNRLPFSVHLGAGFSLNHVPSTLGTHYVGTYLNMGLDYLMARRSFVRLEYQSNYGKSNINGSKTNFDGTTILLGVGFNLDKKKPRKKYIPPKGVQQRSMTPRKKQRQRTKPNRSTYQQSQQLMNELSWPTY